MRRLENAMTNAKNIFSYRKFWAERFGPAPFLPMTGSLVVASTAGASAAGAPATEAVEICCPSPERFVGDRADTAARDGALAGDGDAVSPAAPVPPGAARTYSSESHTVSAGGPDAPKYGAAGEAMTQKR